MEFLQSIAEAISLYRYIFWPVSYTHLTLPTKA